MILEKIYGVRDVPSGSVKIIQKKDNENKNIQFNIPKIEERFDQEKQNILRRVDKVDKEEEIIIETDLLRVVLSNKGGVIKKWELKNYRENIDKDSKKIELLSQDEIDMYPLDITIEGESYGDKFFQIIGEKPRFSGGKKKGTISFLYEENNGVGTLEKKLTFFKDSYRVEIEVIRKGFQGETFIFLGENFGITDWGKKQFVGYVGPMSLVNGKIEKDPLGKIRENSQHFGEIRWAALQCF